MTRLLHCNSNEAPLRPFSSQFGVWSLPKGATPLLHNLNAVLPRKRSRKGATRLKHKRSRKGATRLKHKRSPSVTTHCRLKIHHSEVTHHKSATAILLDTKVTCFNTLKRLLTLHTTAYPIFRF